MNLLGSVLNMGCHLIGHAGEGWLGSWDLEGIVLLSPVPPCPHHTSIFAVLLSLASMSMFACHCFTIWWHWVLLLALAYMLSPNCTEVSSIAPVAAVSLIPGIDVVDVGRGIVGPVVARARESLMSHCCVAVVAIAVAIAVPLLQPFFIIVARKLSSVVMCVEDVAVARLEVVKSGK